MPKHLKHKHIDTVKYAIFDFLAGKNDITNLFYMYSSSLDEKQDTALAIYKDCKDEQAKEYVKKYAVSMLERYIETERYDDFIDFTTHVLISNIFVHFFSFLISRQQLTAARIIFTICRILATRKSRHFMPA